MKDKVEIIIGNGSLVDNSCLCENEYGVISLNINLSERWLAYEKTSGASFEDQSEFITYRFNSYEGDGTNSDTLTITGLDTTGLYCFEEMEKDQLIVRFLPIKLLLGKEILIRTASGN